MDTTFVFEGYIGEGLRKDQSRMQNSQLQAITESLRKQGIDDQIISNAIADARLTPA